MSLTPDGDQWSTGSADSVISDNGRYVAYEHGGIYLYDLRTSTTTEIDRPPKGSADGSSYDPSLSRTGRYIAFQSYASNLVPGDANGAADIFVVDRRSGTIEQITNGRHEDDDSLDSVISATGRYVAYSKRLHDRTFQVYVYDRRLGETRLVSVSPTGRPGNMESTNPQISADGQTIVFPSQANNLVLGDQSRQGHDLYVRDMRRGVTSLVNVSASGAQDTTIAWYSTVTISGDGRFAGFTSPSDLTPRGDSGGAYLRNLVAQRTIRLPKASRGLPVLSATGRYATFVRRVPGPASGYGVFRLDRRTNARIRLDAADGASTDGEAFAAVVSGDGRRGAFTSNGTSVVPGDTNATWDVFAWTFPESDRLVSGR